MSCCISKNRIQKGFQKNNQDGRSLAALSCSRNLGKGEGENPQQMVVAEAEESEKLPPPEPETEPVAEEVLPPPPEEPEAGPLLQEDEKEMELNPDASMESIPLPDTPPPELPDEFLEPEPEFIEEPPLSVEEPEPEPDYLRLENQSNFEEKRASLGESTNPFQQELIQEENSNFDNTLFDLPEEEPLPIEPEPIPEVIDETDWITKLENFAVKYTNKIFRRKDNDRKLRSAVKLPSVRVKLGGDLCKEINHNNPNLEQPTDEAILAAEINDMLDEVAEVINTIPPAYLALVTPIFRTVVNLKSRDFRKTDNRQIFRIIDCYAALIKCESHIMNSTTARVTILIEFIHTIESDSKALCELPRMVTKCYSTESKICQKVCEIYSDNVDHTVNIKKMSKWKP